VKKIIDEFSVKRVKDSAFNDTIANEIEDRKIFNSKYLYRVPEEIKSNIDFFSALRTVGITPMANVLKPVFAPHANRFNLLDGVVMRGTHKVIQRFDVPEYCNKIFHKSSTTTLMGYDGVKVVGKGDKLLYRARSELGGVECVVFGVLLGDEYHFYMWDVDSIYRVESTQPAVFERVDGVLYLLSDPTGLKINVDYKIHPWEIMNAELIESAEVGLVVSVDAEEYKIYRDPVVIVDVRDGRACSKTSVICENIPKIYNGKYKMSVCSNRMVEKVDAGEICSYQEYDVIDRCALRYDEIYDSMYVKDKREIFNTMPIISVDKTSTFWGDYNKGFVRISGLIDNGSIKDSSSRLGMIKRALAETEDAGGRVHLPFRMGNTGYCKNGKLFAMTPYSYGGFRVWNKDGLSNLYVVGWKSVVILSGDDEIREIFERHGICVLYYDPKLWVFDVGDDHMFC